MYSEIKASVGASLVRASNVATIILSLHLIFPAKFLTSFLSPVAVYYAIYYKNKDMIRTIVVANDRDITIFYDKRSELIKEDDNIT